MLMQFSSGGRHGQFSMHHAFGADQGIGQGFDAGAFPADDDDFQAVVMIQVHVGIGNDERTEPVLRVGEVADQIRFVMIIHQRNGSDRFPVVVPLLSHELIPDEIPDGFGPVGVFFSFKMFIEGGKELSIQRNAKSYQLFHRIRIPSETHKQLTTMNGCEQPPARLGGSMAHSRERRLRSERAVQIEGRADEGKMGKGLREIPQRFAVMAGLFRKEA